MPVGFKPSSPTPTLTSTDNRGEFSKGFASGVDQLQALGGGFLALAGSAIGDDDLFYTGLDYYNEQMAEASQYRGEVERIEDIDGFDDFTSWLAFTAGNAIPSLGSSLAGGGIGGAIAKKAVKETVEKKAADYAKKRVGDLADAALRRKVASDYTRNAMSSAITKGATAGAFVPSFGLNSGESFMRIMEETGQEKAGIALGVGVTAGMLDAMAPMAALKRVLPKGTYENAKDAIGGKILSEAGPVTKALNKAVAKADSNFYTRVARRAAGEGVKIGAIEGFTETAQEILQTSAVQYVEALDDPDLRDNFFEELFNESNRSVYLNAFAAGVVGGGLVGGAGGAISKGKAPTEAEVSDREIFDRQTNAPTTEATEANVDRETIDREESEAVEDAEANRASARDAARAELDANPERDYERTRPFGSRRQRQEVARRSIQRDLGLRLQGQVAARAQAKEIGEQLELELKDLSMVGQRVSYQGIEGILNRDNDGILSVVTPDGESIVVESGQSDTSFADLGLTPVEQTVQFENDVSFDPETSEMQVRGRDYNYERVNVDGDNQTVSVSATTPQGEQRTFRNDEVVQRIEQQKIQAEEGDPMQQLLELDSLPVEVQEFVVDRAEEQGQPIPDEIPVNDAIQIAEEVAPETAEQVRETATVSTIIADLQKDPDNKFKPYSSVQTAPSKTANDALATNAYRSLSRTRNSANDQISIDVVSLDDVDAVKNNAGDTIMSHGTSRNRSSRHFNNVTQNQEQSFNKALVDIISSGVPLSLVKDIKGFRVFVSEDVDGADVPAFYDSVNDIIAIRKASLENRGGKVASDLRWNMTHEIGHALDFKLGSVSTTDPAFQLTLADDQRISNVTKVDMGEAIAELYQNYIDDTDLGVIFQHPFYNAAYFIQSNRKSGFSNNNLLKHLQRESWSQAFATYFSNPKLLKDNAPKTYELIQEAVNAYRTEGQRTAGERAEVSEEVRPPATSGRDEGIDDGDARQGGEDSAQAQQADQEMATSDGDVQRGDVPDSDAEPLDIPFETLSPEAQRITASQILYGDETIEVTPQGSKVTIKDLGRAFDERVLAATGKPLDERTDENKAIISDMIAHEAIEAYNREGNAGQWYQDKVAGAMELATQVFPEIATDQNARTAFTAITAVTSNGMAVQENAELSFKLYEDFQKNGRFQIFGTGKEGQAMKKGFQRMNEIIDSDGFDALREFLSTEFTVKELSQLGYNINGELMGEKVYGSAILGPKIGQGFFQNLNGNYDPLTMDRWFMRTWGRLTGTMMGAEKRLPDALAKFRETASLFKGQLRKDGVSIVELRKNDDLAIEYGLKVYRRFSNGSFKDKTALNNSSRGIFTSLQALEAPENGSHRQWIRSVMRDALDKVNAEIDQPINMGALQAIIWYPEKDLYKQLGVGNKRSEPTDYESEFRKIIEARGEGGSGLSGSVGSAQQSGAGDLRSGTAGVDSTQEGSDQETFDIPEQISRVSTSPDLNLPDLQEQKLSAPSSTTSIKERATQAVESVKAARAEPKGFIAEKIQGFVQGVFDDVNRIGYLERQENDGELLDGSESAYKAALWSKNINVVLQSALEAGTIELKDGAFQLVEGSTGFYKIFDGYTKEELRDWELWASANRASRLIQEDRERLFTQPEIDQILNAAKENGLTDKYKQSLSKWIEFNRKMLDLAESAGILDGTKRKLWDKDDYIPFFRFEDEQDTNDLQNDMLTIRRGLAGQGMNLKKLIGGEGKINPLESMVSQITTTLDRSFKNEAMRRMVKVLGDTNAISEVSNTPENVKLATNPESNLIKVFFDGKPKVYQVHDPVLMRSIEGVGGYDMSALMKAFSVPKQVLTRGVTLDPAFMIANAFRDILATTIQFPNAPNPVKSFAKAASYVSNGVAEELGGGIDSESYQQSRQSLYKIMASGGLALGEFYGSGQSNAIRDDINRINSLDTTLNTPEKMSDFYDNWIDLSASKIKGVWDKWNRIGGKFEQVSRINLYEQAIENGETHAEAVSQAADILNFSKRGDYQLIRAMIASYPFFNARLQGLNVLGRSLRDNTQTVLTRGGALAAFSIALYMLNKDNEEYEQLPDYDKDLNFHFFLGDEHYRLPKPFELGFLFGTFPERMVTYALEDKDSEYFFDTFSDGVTQALSFDLFPQLAKPVVDVLSNEDPFREAPIVSRALEDAPPEMQYNMFTSDTAKWIAQNMPSAAPDEMRSPIYLEYLLRSYFGTISGYALQAMDNVVRDPDLPVRPSLMPSQMPILKRFYRTGLDSSKYGTEFYELRRFADQLYNEHKALVENGRTKEASDFLIENGGYEEVRKGIARYYKQIKALNKQRDLVFKDTKLTADEKMKRLNDLYQKRNALYKEAVRKYDRYL